jgi:hypothetical protein
MSIKDRVGWAPLQHGLIMYWRIRDIWNLANIVASMVAELDDTLSRFTNDRRDSVQATQGLPIEVLTWKMALG